MHARSRGELSSAEEPADVDHAALRVATVRPRRSLFRRFLLLAAFVGAPLIAIAVWSEQQFSPGTRSALAWSVVIVVVLTGYAVLRFRRTEISVSPYGLVERGFFGRLTSVAARDVVSVVRLQLYRRASEETTPQLFLVGRDGTCLLRMRGAFWDDESLDAVSASLGITETVRRDPVTLSDLRSSDPGLLYWFERRLGSRRVARPRSGASGRLDRSSEKPSRS